MAGGGHDHAGDVLARDGIGQRHVGPEALAADDDALSALGAQLAGVSVDHGEDLVGRDVDLLPAA